VEWIFPFYKTATIISKVFKSKAIFSNENMLDNFYEADFIYLYGSCLKDSDVLSLIQKFKGIKKEFKVISISYPLSDYDKKIFKTIKKFKVSFPWGDTFCYLNEKVLYFIE
jgi:hypothetical protein